MERRRRFVSSRGLIWSHVWSWLHGSIAYSSYTSGGEGELHALSEPRRLRAAYALAREEGGKEVLRKVLCLPDVSTSVRRTAAYGLIASRSKDVAIGRCKLVREDEEGRGWGGRGSCALKGPDDGEWVSAATIRSVDGFDSEMLLAATGIFSVSENEVSVGHIF